MHVAAALARLPEVQHPAENRRPRLGAVLRLLAGGLAATAHRLDAHQLAGCLEAFGALHMAPHGALTRVCGLLAEGEGARLRDLHPWEISAVARALAALEDEQARLAAEGGGGGGGDIGLEGLKSGTPDSSSSSSSSSGSGMLPDLPAVAPPLLLAGADSRSALLSTEGGPSDGSSTGGSSANALALATPVEALWQLLPEAARPRLRNFPAADLASIAWSLARCNRATKRFMTDASRVALSKPDKFDPDSIAALTSALAAAGHRDDLLLGALAKEVVARKPEFTVPQLAGGCSGVTLPWCQVLVVLLPASPHPPSSHHTHRCTQTPQASSTPTPTSTFTAPTPPRPPPRSRPAPAPSAAPRRPPPPPY
jgi:hypothetical protein